jgi:putative resolvase
MSDFLRMRHAAEYLRITPGTLRKYANEGRIACERTPAGQRVFTRRQLDDFLGIALDDVQQKRVAFYCRDSRGVKASMISQARKLEAAYGAPVLTYSDGASGLNENRKGLQRLLRDSEQRQFEIVAVTAKDRLTRFGFSYLEELLRDRGVEIVVLDDAAEKSLQDELMQDFMSLIASFSGKCYKLRGLEQSKRLLKNASDQLED